MVWSAWREAVAEPEKLDEMITRTAEQWEAWHREQEAIKEAERAEREAWLGTFLDVRG